MSEGSEKPNGRVHTADDERDFDAVLFSPGSMSSEPFLPDQPSPGSVREPIPANRIALIRQIEDQNKELRQRRRIRDMGYKVALVISIIGMLYLLTIFFWMLYLAIANTQYETDLLREMSRRELRMEPFYVGNVRVMMGEDQGKHVIRAKIGPGVHAPLSTTAATTGIAKTPPQDLPSVRVGRRARVQNRPAPGRGRKTWLFREGKAQ